MALETVHGMSLVVSASAYERKASLGGGFRGAATHHGRNETRRGEVRQTLDEARFDAKRLAADLLAGAPCRPAPIYGKGEWRANYWVPAEAAAEGPHAIR